MAVRLSAPVKVPGSPTEVATLLSWIKTIDYIAWSLKQNGDFLENRRDFATYRLPFRLSYSDGPYSSFKGI
jgi:hypothetical protein